MRIGKSAFLASLLAFLPAAAPPAYGPDINGRIFDRAVGIVEHRYWNKPAVEKLEAIRDTYRARVVAAPDRRTVYGLIGEMLDTLGDSHVYVIDPQQIAIGRARTRGDEQAGFGMTMLPDDAHVWRVQSLRADGPAARAGVEIGWEVAQVDGQPIDVDFVPHAGDQARFDFIDEDGRHHAKAIEAMAEAPPQVRRVERLPGNVLLLGLDGFDRGDDRWLADHIGEQPVPSGVILDLRDNGGGDADVIARVAGSFFAENRLLVRRIAARESDQSTRGAGPRSWLGPLAVLVGPNSASGAEALAALIEESGRGLTVGERTAGALTGAAEYDLPDGGIVSVAEFDIRTGGGRRLEGTGFTPRVRIAPSLADRRAGRDPALEKARQLLGVQVARR
ncbi:S41 family peptidase [Sphingomonas sp. BIUV-7]|uniref:S41 family peptidase n=1 Tax=Sphingomonas natans TaxID=3063330 RepID=A0ABT8YBD0_9SPHN|nr:S41 family peptidase [Sphingomonas sp. BIUV-7]MDO6415625.1 S41 family peptidase [Sphingomonas sp. BIUV-7]